MAGSRRAERASGAGSDVGVVAALGRWPGDEAVLRRAVEGAVRRATCVTILHVDDRRASGGRVGPARPVLPRTHEEHVLLVAAERAAREWQSGLVVHTVLYAGSVLEGILQTSRRADLVVVGTGGAPADPVRGGPAPTAPDPTEGREPVTAAVVARAAAPVDVVPTGTAPR